MMVMVCSNVGVGLIHTTNIRKNMERRLVKVETFTLRSILSDVGVEVFFRPHSQFPPTANTAASMD